LTNTELKQMGKRIKRQILSNDYVSIENFANVHDIPKQTLYHIVRGDRNPRISTLIDISKKLKISITELINF